MSPIRRRFLELVLAVGVLHVAAIALYYALGVARASLTEQRVFAWTWMGATVFVVFAGLQRVKRLRGSRRRP